VVNGDLASGADARSAKAAALTRTEANVTFNGKVASFGLIRKD